MLRENEIPKDVSEAARLVLNVPEVKSGYTATFDLVYLSERIARAILAERERCAKVAETMQPMLTETMELPPSQYDIADKIRNPT